MPAPPSPGAARTCVRLQQGALPGAGIPHRRPLRGEIGIFHQQWVSKVMTKDQPTLYRGRTRTFNSLGEKVSQCPRIGSKLDDYRGPLDNVSFAPSVYSMST